MEALTIPLALQAGDPDDGALGRQLRGLAISAAVTIRKNKLGYSVPSVSGNGEYFVSVEGELFCSCPDFERRQQPCKHVFSVYCVAQREGEKIQLAFPEVPESVEAPEKEKRDWHNYNEAQMHEGECFAKLYRALCDSVREPERPPRRGRPFLPLSDVLYGIGVKVYSGMSGRRAMSDIWSAKEQGLLDKAPSFASVGRYLKNPELTPLLESMITLSSLPLREVETHFAQDSTGFSANSYHKWYEEKWGADDSKEKKERKWAKAHFTVGIKSHIIAKANVTANPSGDSPFLIPHLNTVKEYFTVKEYSADLGYLSKPNLLAIEKAGATPLIKFKKNSVPHLVVDEGDAVWNRLLAYFTFNRAEFDKRYHQRNNVESAIGAVKAKLGEKLLCKSDEGMVNEVLTKALVYNITALVHARYVLEIESVFEDLLSTVGVAETPLLVA